jgi:hypothetical protein
MLVYLSIEVARCLEAGAVPGSFDSKWSKVEDEHPASGIRTSENTPSTHSGE